MGGLAGVSGCMIESIGGLLGRSGWVVMIIGGKDTFQYWCEQEFG